MIVSHEFISTPILQDDALKNINLLEFFMCKKNTEGIVLSLIIYPKAIKMD